MRLLSLSSALLPCGRRRRSSFESAHGSCGLAYCTCFRVSVFVGQLMLCCACCCVRGALLQLRCPVASCACASQHWSIWGTMALPLASCCFCAAGSGVTRLLAAAAALLASFLLKGESHGFLTVIRLRLGGLFFLPHHSLRIKLCAFDCESPQRRSYEQSLQLLQITITRGQEEAIVGGQQDKPQPQQRSRELLSSSRQTWRPLQRRRRRRRAPCRVHRPPRRRARQPCAP